MEQNVEYGRPDPGIAEETVGENLSRKARRTFSLLRIPMLLMLGYASAESTRRLLAQLLYMKLGINFEFNQARKESRLASFAYHAHVQNREHQHRLGSLTRVSCFTITSISSFTKSITGPALISSWQENFDV